jgi:orotate phosphoribosyltransferase
VNKKAMREADDVWGLTWPSRIVEDVFSAGVAVINALRAVCNWAGV